LKTKRLRIIPRLDIKGPNLVKGIHLEGLRVLGDPAIFAQRYYEEGADELVFMDVVASLYERNSLHSIISRTASNVFIPITCGGGIRSLQDIRQILRAGADKVSINTAAVKRPEFIREAALEFGSSTIVVAIEAIRQASGQYLAFIDNGREHTGIDVIEWAEKMQSLGAGEILITSVDREGTGMGFDIELTQTICSRVSVPVIAHGGAGQLQHVLNLAQQTDISGVAPASIFHYDLIRRVNTFSDTAQTEGNIQFLSSNRSFGKIEPVNLAKTKKALEGLNIRTRKTRGGWDESYQ
jgi:cyclase